MKKEVWQKKKKEKGQKPRSKKKRTPRAKRRRKMKMMKKLTTPRRVQVQRIETKRKRI